MAKRKSELSLMNVILCLLVIFIHCASTPVSIADKASWQFGVIVVLQRLAYFAVPGFIFLSGLKFSLTSDKAEFSYFRYIAGRIKRVWIPYAIAAAVYFAYFVWAHYMQPSAGEFLRMLLDGKMSSHFYFVVVIMQFYLLAPLWKKIAQKLDEPIWAAAAMSIALLVGMIFGQYLTDFIYIFYKGGIFPYADRVFSTYIFWWICGMAAGRHYGRVKRELAANFRGVTILYLAAALMSGYFGYLHFSGKQTIYWLETVHVFYTVCSIIFLFALCIKLASTRAADTKLVTLIDRTSYSIYLWHPLMLYFAKAVLAGKNASLTVTFLVHSAFAFGGTIAVCGGASVLFGMIRNKFKR